MRPSDEYSDTALPPVCYGDLIIAGARKSTKAKTSTVKYCSDRCRNRKPGPRDKRIERTITSLLNSEEDSGIEKTGAESRKIKGDKRVIVTMDEIEEVAFDRPKDPEKVYGRTKDRRKRGVPEKGEWQSVDMETSEDDVNEEQNDATFRQVKGDHVRPSQLESEVNFSVGGERGKQEKIEEDEAMKQRRDEGQRLAEEREMVRRAARRGIVFGFVVPAGGGEMKAGQGGQADGGGVEIGVRRKCEALMNGNVVEPSYAKGNWSVRWRDNL